MEDYKKLFKLATKYESKRQPLLAKEYYEKALKCKQTIPCLSKLSKLCIATGNPLRAIECLEQIVYLSPASDIQTIVISLNEIGVLYNQSGEYEKAIEYFKKTLIYKKDIADVYINIGICYLALKQYKQAEVVFLISEKYAQNESVFKNLANLYCIKKQYDKSIHYYRRILNIENDDTLLYNLSFTYLAKKEFKIGFNMYERRLKFNNIHPQTNEISRVEVDIPYWNGVDDICNRLMVIYEQGIGDNIQYFRFLIELAQLCPTMQITYFCKSNVSHLFNCSHHCSNLFMLDDSKPLFNLHGLFDKKIYIMSLPFYLNVNKIEVNPYQYIVQNEEKNTFWKDKLTALKGDSLHKLNVGFVYNGLLTSFIEKHIPLNEFAMLAELEFVNLICLHKQSDVQSELASVSFSDKITLFDIDKEKAFEDTIAILNQLDLFISIDTSLVHLAGALNVKTWLLLGFGSDWRWFDDSNKVWYSSVELIRMTENKELKHILPEIKDRLMLLDK